MPGPLVHPQQTAIWNPVYRLHPGGYYQRWSVALRHWVPTLLSDPGSLGLKLVRWEDTWAEPEEARTLVEET